MNIGLLSAIAERWMAVVTWISLTVVVFGVDGRQAAALRYDLHTLWWYDPQMCYVIEPPPMFSPAGSPTGSRDHWREHGRGSSCPAATLKTSNDSKVPECGKLLLRRSILPLMMESLNSVTAHVDSTWQPTLTDLGWNWTFGSRDQFTRTRLSQVEENIKILWDILAYRMSNGTEGAELTSQHSWNQLLRTPDVSELESMAVSLWNLEILVNRNEKNLLPLVKSRAKESSRISNQLMKEAEEIKERIPEIIENLNKTLTDVRLLTHFFKHNKKSFKSHRSFYLKLKKRIRVWRRLKKVGRRIAKRRRLAKENLFIILRPYQKANSWNDKCRKHNETAERMRYRVTYGDIKSNVLDIKNQLVWIKADTKRARKILKSLTPNLSSLKDKVDQLLSLRYSDLMLDNIKAAMQAARNNYLELHGLSRRLSDVTPELAIKCAYLDVIVSPTRYEKARADLALGHLLRQVAFVIRTCQSAFDVSKPYVALSTFVVRRHDDCVCAPIERTLDQIKDLHQRAAALLEDALTRPWVADAAMRSEGLMPVSDTSRRRRRLLWFWQDKDDDDDDKKTTTMTSASTTVAPTSTRRTRRPKKTRKPTSTVRPTTRPTTAVSTTRTKPKPGKATSAQPTPKPSTVEDRVTEPQTDFYFEGDDDDVTASQFDPSNHQRPGSQGDQSQSGQFFDDEDFGFSGSGFGSGDIDEDLSTTQKVITSSTTTTTTTTTAPPTTTRPIVKWVNWPAIKKLVRKTAKPLTKDGRKHLHRLNTIKKTTDDLQRRVNVTRRTHRDIKRTNKEIRRNLKLKGLEFLDGKSDELAVAAADVARRQEELERKALGIVFNKAPFMEKYKQTLISLDSYTQGSYTAIDSEMKQLRRTIQEIDDVSTSLYKRALNINDTIRDIRKSMGILRRQIQTARLALSGIHSKIQIKGSTTYELEYHVKSESFNPGSLHLKIQTNQPDGAILAMESPDTLGRPRTPRRVNRLAVGLQSGKVTAYVEPWRHKWQLPGIINDGRWHEIGIYILKDNILITENVMANVYTGEYKEVQRRMYDKPKTIDLNQYFTKNYHFVIGKLPYSTWPFSPDPQFQACLSELRVDGFYMPMFLIKTTSGRVAPSCVGQLVLSELPDADSYKEPDIPWLPKKEEALSSPITKNLSNVYTLYGTSGDTFMFRVYYTGQSEGGVVVYLALAPTLHISLHHRYGRIIVTYIEGDRYASAVCRTYGTDQSAHSIYAVTLGDSVEFIVDCKRCQSLPFLSSISRHFPFYKPELIVAPTSEQLDYYLQNKPRARRQVAPFNGVITRVTLDGVLLYNSPSFRPGCKNDIAVDRYISRHRNRHKQK